MPQPAALPTTAGVLYTPKSNRLLLGCGALRGVLYVCYKKSKKLVALRKKTVYYGKRKCHLFAESCPVGRAGRLLLVGAVQAASLDFCVVGDAFF